MNSQGGLAASRGVRDSVNRRTDTTRETRNPQSSLKQGYECVPATIETVVQSAIRRRLARQSVLVTNTALRELLAGIGRPIPLPPSEALLDAAERATCGVWLTNALLWLKHGGLSSAMKPEWFDETTRVLLQEQIALVQPRVVVALGRQAYDTILRAYDLPPHNGAFLRAVEDQRGSEIPNGSSSFSLLAVYHCGARIRNTIRPYAAQVRDWARVRAALSRSTA